MLRDENSTGELNERVKLRNELKKLTLFRPIKQFWQKRHNSFQHRLSWPNLDSSAGERQQLNSSWFEANDDVNNLRSCDFNTKWQLPFSKGCGLQIWTAIFVRETNYAMT